ncbi:MAG: alanine racemase [Chloroflexi bacterium]|nr:alanine racemase [Chloroflexota bacterium]
MQPSSTPHPTLAEATRARNAWIEVDLDAIEANVRALRGWIGPGVELIAVVKANAYGHGVEGVAPALERAGVDRLAVVWMPEALGLRALGLTLPVLVLGHAFPEDAPAAVEASITMTCHSRELGRALSLAAVAAGKTATVHVKVDTGLHRFGVAPDEAVALAEFLRTLPGVEVEGLWTHMANADEADDSFSSRQRAVFEATVKRLPWVPYRHTANSATALRRGELRYEGVRSGLALRGVLPPNSPGPDLQPILALKARLARVHAIEPGEGVSYGLAWKAGAASRIGLVPVGYADGWKRQLGTAGGRVLVAGVPCPMVGRAAMDQFMVDVTAVPTAAEGDEVVLIGDQGGERITADEVAAHAGTISWDVVAPLGARLPRLFHRGGLVELVI